MTRDGLRTLIGRESDLSICGEAADVPTVLRFLERAKPELVLMDFNLDGEGVESIRKIHAAHPQIPVLVFSARDERFFIEQELRAGARGHIGKCAGGADILQAIRAVLAGKIYADEQVKDRLLRKYADGRTNDQDATPTDLSVRESEVFALLSDGYGPKEISGRLRMSVRTVEGYESRICRKLCLGGCFELRKYAISTRAQNSQSPNAGSLPSLAGISRP